ncbi:MAG TPA: tetratricopeptide repeat protein [Pirellulales bacterium]|nr:tetratricopeptide repeat protein [Pirellulales bacterium]
MSKVERRPHNHPASSYPENSGRRQLAISAALAVAVALTYGGSLRNGFVNFDDDRYVFANPHVQQGLSLSNIEWAFRATDCANWHPITWLSLQLDVTLFGPKAWGFHFANLLLHGANVLLLFHVLSLLTGALGRSALVAALFAVHPLHVESVAWVAERKDVLSGFFFFLALLAWYRYLRQPGWRPYGVVMLALACGLLAKPMLVTFPFVLLLLDWWPCARWRPLTETDETTRAFDPQSAQRLLLEKVPLLVLAIASSIVTYLVQRQGGAVISAEQLPWVERLANVPVAYAAYLAKAVWPVRLAVYYPHSATDLSIGPPFAAGVLLLATSGAAVMTARRRPYLFVGWFWWLGMLVPVIGLVQVGTQAWADRYMYLPIVGLWMAVIWGGHAFETSFCWSRWPLRGLLACSLLGSGLLSHRQVGYWHDGVSLWQHATEVGPPNPVAYNSLGIALAERGEPEEAIEWFKKGLALAPDDERCHQNLALALTAVRRFEESLDQFQEVLRINPDNSLAQFNAGVLLEHRGKPAEGIEHFRRALEIDPTYWRAHLQMGRALLKTGQTTQGEYHIQEALRLHPELLNRRRP